MPTSVSNILSLRAGSIGSMSAWLPSRRSTLHQRGALVIRADGQVRSSRRAGRNGRYFSNGILVGTTGGAGIVVPLGIGERRKRKNLPAGGAGGSREHRSGARLGKKEDGANRCHDFDRAYFAFRCQTGLVVW